MKRTFLPMESIRKSIQDLSSRHKQLVLIYDTMDILPPGYPLALSTEDMNITDLCNIPAFVPQTVVILLGGALLQHRAIQMIPCEIEYIAIPTTLQAMINADLYRSHSQMQMWIAFEFLSFQDQNSYERDCFFALRIGMMRSQRYYSYILEHAYELFERDEESLQYLIDEYWKIWERTNTASKESVLERIGYGMPEYFGLSTVQYTSENIASYEHTTLSYEHTALSCEHMALSCLLANYLSYQQGLLSFDDYLEMRDVFVLFHLPITMLEADIPWSDKIRSELLNKPIETLRRCGKTTTISVISVEEYEKAVKELIYH